MGSRIHFARLPREAIRNTFLGMLDGSGETISQMEARHGRNYPGDGSQDADAAKPVWCHRQDLIIRVAKKMGIHQTYWGSGRTSNDFHNAIDQEIAKLRGKGHITDWNHSRRLGIFRVTKPLSFQVPYMVPSMEGPVPEYGAEQIAVDTSEENMKRVFLGILTGRNKSNTYKFSLARVLLDFSWEHRHEDARTHDIPYEYLAGKFLRYYWHQEYRFRIKQDFRVKSGPRAITEIRKVFGDSPPADFGLLDEDSVSLATQKILRGVFGHARSKTSLVVPKFQKIDGGTREERVFYEYDDDKKMLYLRPEALRFFARNHGILLRAVFAEWAKFLERTNGSLPKLVAKIERNDNEVERGDLSQFRRMYLEYTNHCFYCAGRLESGFTAVDHFIPWSYIFDDDPWNLVLACRNCNSKKSDALPQDEFYHSLIRRNKVYRGRIRHLNDSLELLNVGNGWEAEIDTHYRNCLDYGFRRIRMP